MSNTTPLITAYDLKKDYDSAAGPLPILKGVHFSLERGKMAFIVGRSGCGKSTLLHLLAGLDQPTHGKILFEGEDMTQMSEKALSRIRSTRLGLVFQFYHLLPELTLYENVILPAMISGQVDKVWAKEVLKRVKLLSRQTHYPSELSGGEQQRAAIARALIQKPSVILCDEPTGNLDEETAESVMSLICDLNQHEGQAFLIVTHDEELAWRFGQVYRLHDGALLSENRGQVNIKQLS